VATGRLAQAEELNAAAHARLQNVIELTKKALRRPRVLCLEWIDPYYCCGHWVPEMVELAGGEEALGRKGADSVRISWTDIAALSPEILIVSPCGFGVEEAAEQAKQLLQQPGWNDLPAVLTDRVFAVNANAYFARPGPRVVDGVELLAHLIHPELWDWRGSRNAFPTDSLFPMERRQTPRRRSSSTGARINILGPEAISDRRDVVQEQLPGYAGGSAL
jgi:iron complex transport system substrate-binding protein